MSGSGRLLGFEIGDRFILAAEIALVGLPMLF